MTSSKWNYVSHPETKGERLLDVGLFEDGSLRNPNGYPEDVVRRGVEAAIARRTTKRKAAAKAVGPRKWRHEQHVHEVAKKLLRSEKIDPSQVCVICRKGLNDRESIQRGIGPECWQGVLSAIERIKGRLS